MAAEPAAKTHRTEGGAGKPFKSLAQKEAEEEESFKTGPFRLLYDAVHNPKTQVVVTCRNDKKVLGKVRAFDRHFNMVLEGCNEVWTDPGSQEPKMRFLPKIFLRGDTVILVTKVTTEDDE